MDRCQGKWVKGGRCEDVCSVPVRSSEIPTSYEGEGNFTGRCCSEEVCSNTREEDCDGYYEHGLFCDRGYSCYESGACFRDETCIPDISPLLCSARGGSMRNGAECNGLYTEKTACIWEDYKGNERCSNVYSLSCDSIQGELDNNTICDSEIEGSCCNYWGCEYSTKEKCTAEVFVEGTTCSLSGCSEKRPACCIYGFCVENYGDWCRRFVFEESNYELLDTCPSSGSCVDSIKFESQVVALPENVKISVDFSMNKTDLNLENIDITNSNILIQNSNFTVGNFSIQGSVFTIDNTNNIVIENCLKVNSDTEVVIELDSTDFELIQETGEINLISATCVEGSTDGKITILVNGKQSNCIKGNYEKGLSIFQFDSCEEATESEQSEPETLNIGLGMMFTVPLLTAIYFL
eukprot:TRINITY_DN6781_c0_g1_i2.p1 TRINITY_DN6781_c0_g1~~TRINITY_DN6781_c0_g1_i2.p1  ORF type:complete len:407 (-),score=92.61 TRINITY_DN6781_c0_g1_i2:29-1249(-)